MDKTTQVLGKQILRGLVLEIANNAEPLGAGTEVIKGALKHQGYRLTKDEILEACNYLKGKGLVEMENVSNEVLGISRDIAHITPKGVDVLEGTETVSGIELGG